MGPVGLLHKKMMSLCIHVICLEIVFVIIK